MGTLGLRSTSAVALGLVLSLESGTARAQDSDALAEALYRSALELMEQGKEAEACPKLKQSQEIDPAVGTLLYLGLCYERLGKTASAWAAYRAASEASRKANQPERQKIALERAEKLEPVLSSLTIHLPEAASLPNVEVVLDGVPVGTAAVGQPMPVDPGEHVVEVTAPGYLPLSERVNVAEQGASSTVTLGPLQRLPGSSSGPQPPPAADPGVSADTGMPADVTTSGGGAQRTWGLVVGGVGLVGLGVGTYFGVRTQNKEDEARSNCTNYPTGCNATGLEANDAASSAANYATGAFIVGGVGLVTGLVLYLTAPSEAPGSRAGVRLEPTVGGDTQGLRLTGSF